MSAHTQKQRNKAKVKAFKGSVMSGGMFSTKHGYVINRNPPITTYYVQQPQMAPFFYSPVTGFNYAYNPQTGFYEFHTGQGIIHLYDPRTQQYSYVQQPSYQQPSYQQPSYQQPHSQQSYSQPSYQQPQISEQNKYYAPPKVGQVWKITISEVTGNDRETSSLIEKKIQLTYVDDEEVKGIIIESNTKAFIGMEESYTRKKWDDRSVWMGVHSPYFKELIEYDPSLRSVKALGVDPSTFTKKEVPKSKNKENQRVDPSELPAVGSRWYYKIESPFNPNAQYVIGADMEYILGIISVEDQEIKTKVTWTKGDILTDKGDIQIFSGKDWMNLPNKRQLQEKNTPSVTPPVIEPVRESVTPAVIEPVSQPVIEPVTQPPPKKSIFSRIFGSKGGKTKKLKRKQKKSRRVR